MVAQERAMWPREGAGENMWRVGWKPRRVLSSSMACYLTAELYVSISCVSIQTARGARTLMDPPSLLHHGGGAVPSKYPAVAPVIAPPSCEGSIARSRFCTRSSMVPRATMRCTVTGRVWPMRWMRATACCCWATLKLGSRRTRWFAAVNVTPALPASLVPGRRG